MSRLRADLKEFLRWWAQKKNIQNRVDRMKRRRNTRVDLMDWYHCDGKLIGTEVMPGPRLTVGSTILGLELREFKPQLAESYSSEEIIRALKSKISVSLEGASIELYSDQCHTHNGVVDRVRCDLVVPKDSPCEIL